MVTVGSSAHGGHQHMAAIPPATRCLTVFVVWVLMVVVWCRAASLPPAPYVVWKYKAGDNIESSPAMLGPYLYFGDNGGTVYCLDGATGTLIWQHDVGGNVKGRPAVYEGPPFAGTTSTVSNIKLVFVGTTNNRFVALDAVHGTTVWYVATQGDVQSSPCVHHGLQLVFYGRNNGDVYARHVDNGTVAWRNDELNESPRGSLVLDGTTLYVKTKSELMALNATNGSVVWHLNDNRQHSDSDPHPSPAVHNGTVYWGGDDGVFGVDAASGTPYRFIGQAAVEDSSSPVLHYDSARAEYVVLVGSTDGISAYALHPSGVSGATGIDNLLWTSTECGDDSALDAPAAASHDGYVYLGSNDHTLCALKLADGASAWNLGVEGRVRTQPLLWDGLILFGDTDGYMYAVRQWPTPTTTSTLLMSVSAADGSPSLSSGSVSWTEGSRINSHSSSATGTCSFSKGESQSASESTRGSASSASSTLSPSQEPSLSERHQSITSPFPASASSTVASRSRSPFVMSSSHTSGHTSSHAGETSVSAVAAVSRTPTAAASSSHRVGESASNDALVSATPSRWSQKTASTTPAVSGTTATSLASESNELITPTPSMSACRNPLSVAPDGGSNTKHSNITTASDCAYVMRHTVYSNGSACVVLKQRIDNSTGSRQQHHVTLDASPIAVGDGFVPYVVVVVPLLVPHSWTLRAPLLDGLSVVAADEHEDDASTSNPPPVYHCGEPQERCTRYLLSRVEAPRADGSAPIQWRLLATCATTTVPVAVTLGWPGKTTLNAAAQAVIGVATLGALGAGNDVSTVASLAMLGLLTCGQPPQLSSTAYIVSVFYDYGPTAIALGNLGMMAVACGVHLGVVLCVARAWRCGMWDDQMKFLRFPAVPMMTADFLFPGAVFGAAAAIASGAAAPLAAGVCALLVVGCMLVGAQWLLLRHVLLRTAFVCYTPSSSAAVGLLASCEQTLLLPTRHWLPDAMRLRYQPLMGHLKRRYWWLRMWEPVPAVCLAVVTGWLAGAPPSSVAALACRAMTGVVAGAYLFFACVLIVLRPHRRPMDRLCSPAMHAIFGTVCALGLAGARDVADGMQLALSVVQVWKSACSLWVGFRESRWARERRRQELLVPVQEVSMDACAELLADDHTYLSQHEMSTHDANTAALTPSQRALDCRLTAAGTRLPPERISLTNSETPPTATAAASDVLSSGPSESEYNAMFWDEDGHALALLPDGAGGEHSSEEGDKNPWCIGTPLV